MAKKPHSFDDPGIINPPPSPDPNPPQGTSVRFQILKQIAQLQKQLAALEKLAKKLPNQAPPVPRPPRKK
jgi:hypothetical protein